MGVRLLIYLIVLAAGAILGYKDVIGKKLSNRLTLIQTSSLFFLLFIMGNRMGLDEKVVSSFLSIGYKAGVIAVITIGSTILVVNLLNRLIISKREENKIEH